MLTFYFPKFRLVTYKDPTCKIFQNCRFNGLWSCLKYASCLNIIGAWNAKAAEYEYLIPRRHEWYTAVWWIIIESPIRNGVKCGCVLALTLFGVFFLLLLYYASAHLTNNDWWELFILVCLRANTKVWQVWLRRYSLLMTQRWHHTLKITSRYS